VTPEEPGPSALPPDQTRKAVQNTGTPAEPKSLDLPELDAPTAESADIQRVSMLHDVNLRVKIELGRTWMLVEEVLRLGQGSVVELDKLAGDPVDVYVNDRLIARGEVLVLNDNFCVRISEVLSHDPHRVPV
jgi:flagellar motor switch protein FliN/FliY